MLEGDCMSEQKDEFIKKSDVKKIIENIIPSFDTPDARGYQGELILTAQEICVDILRMVEKALPANVGLVVNKEWKAIISPDGNIEGWICECGRESKEMSKYCPSCGARMNGRNKGTIFPLCFGYYDIHSNCCKYRCTYNDCCKEDYIERIRIN